MVHDRDRWGGGAGRLGDGFFPAGRSDDELRARFVLPVPDGVDYLSRTHPIVEALAGYVADTSLDPLGEPLAARCGSMRTSAVTTRTTLLLVRMRFDVVTTRITNRTQRQPARLAELVVGECAGPTTRARQNEVGVHTSVLGRT